MSRSRSVAIVGMGCRFAGARDLTSFWQMCLDGRDGFGPPPADRWPHEAFFDSNPRARDKTYAPAGGFIEDIRSFPAVALGIPPRRVEVMDPQQRMMLEVSLEAVRDSGRRPEDLPRRTGVYAGVTANEFRMWLSGRITAQLMASGAMGDVPQDMDALASAVGRLVPPRPFTAPGVLGNMIAATTAQELRLTGPAFTSDAACASSLISISEAVYALRDGRVDAALAGGVYLQLTPENYICFSRIGAISKQGRCLPFDARADGFVQGDGCGVLLLKRLEDAERDGDRVYAVIDGMALNNDGGGDGPMAPVLSGQVDVVKRAWADADMDPARLGYLEAHGTGTSVGDRIELSGLVESAPGEQPVALGSAKANIGHTMSAAGVAGVIRAALAIKHATIPPMAGFEGAKDELNLAGTRFAVPTAPQAWDAEDRVAGVSSFGFGGTNVHAVLRSVGATVSPVVEQAELVLLSAPDEASLADLAARMAATIEADPSATVAGIARALAVRTPQPARLAMVVSTRQELLEQLRNPEAGITGVAPEAAPRVGFVFPGQGAQKVGMLRGARERFDVVRHTLDALSPLTSPSLDELLYPADLALEAAQTRLTATENCQPAMVATGVALWRLLESLGIEPLRVAGHSVGEFTAAVAGGVLSASDGVVWAAERGAAMAALEGDAGSMAALRCGVEAASDLLVDGAVLANLNHKRQTVVSGRTEAVAQVVANAEAAGVRAKLLTVSHGFHSPVLARLDLTSVVAGLELSDPTVEVISCIKDGAYLDAADARAVFAAHATSPVDWVRTMDTIDVDLLVQVGAGGPLVSFARGAGINAVALCGDSQDDGGVSILKALGKLWTFGVGFDPRAILGPAPTASLPPMVYARKAYWPVMDDAVGRMALSSAQSARAMLEGGMVAGGMVEGGMVEGGDEPVAETSDDVAGRVLAAVATASAYPLASLKPEMTLTGDLGFDSMMLAELSAELAKAVPGMDGIPQEVLANEPTIAALIEVARTGGVSGGEDVDDDAPLSRYGLVWRPAALLPGAERNGPVVVHVPTHQPVGVGAVLAGEAVAPDPAASLIQTLDAAAGRGERPDVLALLREDDPWAEAVAGVVRCAAREWPQAVCKVIWSDGLDTAAVDAERCSTDRSVDVRYQGGQRYVVGTQKLDEVQAYTPASGEVVLVTGGSRGIGARLADALELKGATVLRLGRAQADVTDSASLRRWLATQPPVDTLVHAAGLLADGPLGSVSAAAGALARRVKVQGLLNVVRGCGSSLTRVLALGSWAGRFGNRNQAHYAAANALMASVVASLPARITGATAELGPWTNSEMAASIPDGIKSAMRRQGIDFVGDDAGLAALLEELNAGQGTVVRGRRVPTSLRAASLGTTLSTDNAPWLLDHAIDGKPVLPLARAAGMLAETAGLSAPCSLADVTLYQGVSVREPAKLQLSVAQDVAELRMGDTLCYRATVAHGALPISVERRVGGDAPTVPLEAFYGEHTFHGPLLQGITSIEGVGADFVHGTLRVGGDRPVDMLALDSAMQLSAYVAFTRFGRAGTPVSIAEYRQLAPWTDTVHAQAVFGDGQGDRFEADLAFWSPDGTLIAVANGVVARMAARDVQPTDVATRWTNPSEWPEVMALQARMDEVAAMGLTNPYFDLHEGTARDTSRMGGRDVMNFSSYNYLGLSGDERIIEDVYQAMKTYGTSVSASRVASGERPFHRALEAGLAAAQGVEDAIVFPSGHATNVTVIGHLFTEKDLILHDELIHDSCLQGIKLSGAQRRSFKHDDPASLEDQIKRLRGHYERCLILIEGVYSMDGDVANLPEYVRLKEQYGCLLMIDEAHSFGTIGKTGRGISEHYGIDGARVDLWMGTMSKSLASMGGWIAGSKVLMRYLRYTTPGFVFAAGVTPTVGQTALSALGLMQEEPWRVERLQHNSRYFFDQLQANGLDTGPARGESPVIPVITGDSAQALLLAERLLEAGVNAKPIVYPAVPEDVSRLRFFLSALHSEEQLKTTARLVGQILTGVREQLSK